MRPLLLALVLLPVLAPAGPVKRTLFAELEKKLDNRLEQAIPDEPFLLLGNTRGVYLEKYGAVFTAEVSLLATATVSPFMQTMPPAAIVRVHNRKLQRLPVLKQHMRKALIDLAATLDDVPAAERVAFAVSLFYFSWEGKAGLPAQILMSGERGKLIDLQAGRAGDSMIRVEEF